MLLAKNAETERFLTGLIRERRLRKTYLCVTFGRPQPPAALLHDYFLYDWHDKDPSHRLHGFTHPRRALENAAADWELTDRERDIILHHMFPLTPLPPRSREAWLVCLADKLCAVQEMAMTPARRRMARAGA